MSEKKPNEMNSEELMRHLFPAEVVEEAKRLASEAAEKAKRAAKRPIKDKDK